MRPLIHNEKYSKITNFVLLKVLGTILFDSLEHHELAVNLSESVFGLIKEVDRELENIDVLSKLDGMLEMVEGLFGDNSGDLTQD